MTNSELVIALLTTYSSSVHAAHLMRPLLAETSRVKLHDSNISLLDEPLLTEFLHAKSSW
jgi:hypothetical protein